MRACLVELKERLLPEMPAEMGEYARQRLVRRGDRVMPDTAIKEVAEDHVVVGEGEVIPARDGHLDGGRQAGALVRESGVEVDRAAVP